MKIEIAERLCPFSHTPGASCLIPCSDWEIEAYPTLLRFGKRIEALFQLTGPVQGFTLQQDLEKNCVWVFGEAKEGYYRFKIEASDAGIELLADKLPAKGILCNGQRIHRKDRIYFPALLSPVSPKKQETLSLGNHKAQNWDQIRQRGDLKEILPVLFSLGQKIPYIQPQPLLGTARLLKLPEERTAIAPALQNLFYAAFTHILVPRLRDDQYHGFVPEETAEGSPLFLIQEAHKLIRALFFSQNERRLKFLGALPPEFHSGRMLRLAAEGIGEIDFEWSKKLLQRVVLRATTAGEAVLELQKEIKSYRVRKNSREKGRRQKATEPLLLEPGKTYLLDRFQR